MTEKDRKNEDDDTLAGKSLFPDDMNPYAKDDSYYNTGLWPILDSVSGTGLDEWSEFEQPSDKNPSSVENTPSGKPEPIVLPPEGSVDSKDMQVLFTERDARNVRFRNLIAKGRHMMALGVDAAAEKYFRKAADEGYHEANYQIALVRINRVMKEEAAGSGPDAQRGPDARDAGSGDGSGRGTMRRDLAEHFALMADSLFRYADDHMILQTREVLEKAASLGLVGVPGPEGVAGGYRAILKRHSETSWDIINYDEASAIQNLMVMFSVCRNADHYDMSGMVGVLLVKLKEFMATKEFE